MFLYHLHCIHPKKKANTLNNANPLSQSLVKKGLPISQSKLLTSNAAKLKCQFPEILSFSNNYWKQFGAEQLKLKKNTVA